MEESKKGHQGGDETGSLRSVYDKAKQSSGFTDEGRECHDDRFTNWVNGRIGDLGKELLEEFRHASSHLREARQRFVIAH